ncbi:hypothetical protein EFU50_15040 [Vibrio cholerae]|nr:hypothetical protein [Vibrio cholerae]EGR2516253.1 hypothetical protein [Vibrio cholerae]
MRKRKEARVSRSDYLDQDEPRPLTPEEIEDLRQEMKDASAKMQEELERRRKTKNLSQKELS